MMHLISSKVCMKKDVGLNGNLFGGNMLAWMDEIAYLYADKVTGGRYFMVTKLFGEINFLRPVKEGDIVDFRCGNAKIGNSSVQFTICAAVRGDDVFKTSAVFVALNEDGSKSKINPDVCNLDLL